MKNKTAMQEMLDCLVKQKESYLTHESNYVKNVILEGLIQKAEKLLKKEKKLIINAYAEGQSNVIPIVPESYYEENYKVKK
jgi:hypothetical protein